MRNDLFVSRWIRISLVAVYLLFSVQRLMALGVSHGDEVVFYTTVDRNAVFIFFGYLCVLFDNGLIRNACCETVYLRFSSKRSWLRALIWKSLREILLLCAATCILLACLMLLFGLTPVFSVRSILFDTVLFLYATMLRLVLILLNLRIGNLHIAIGVTLAVNTAALAIGHSDVYPAGPDGVSWILLAAAYAALDLFLGALSFFSLKRYELYSDKNRRVLNGS